MTVPDSILLNLPVELLEMIFQHLQRSPSSLYSLTLTCSKFQVLTTPLLYTSICLTNPINCEQLARTLEQSSWLSSLVLDFQEHFHDAQIDQIYYPLIDAITEMQNLESLTLRSVPSKINRTLLVFLMQNKDNAEIEPPSRYVGQGLRSLYLGAYKSTSWSDGWDLSQNEIVFYMEQLEKLHIQGAIIDSLRPGSFGKLFPPKKTALKDLALVSCQIEPSTFGQILAFPTGLTHITMRGGWSQPSGAFEREGFRSEYIAAIQRSDSSDVEYLDFDMMDTENKPAFDRLYCLKQLTIPIETYAYHERNPCDEFGASDLDECLPASLETLILNEFDRKGTFFDSIGERVEAGELPNLRTVIYRRFYGEGQKESTEGWEDGIETLRELGVEFSIVSHHGPTTMPENDNWPCGCWVYAY
ncbi:hypothetical protein DTO006G1_5504 [Penicillium roqueforti]|uniref:F-box domain, cyclin-like n=1 Tax=Penicillium roqueforti (strain FM164) TaxID=1365484 RepID=W6Q9P3_PENRF|nr:uncharacterized protein LCP9604111_9490 [Penicillium roqueforti]CDM33130.1 F-box domain, cyclin-like [Penicillium roqueforti FM164]KAF9238286.1 hypothetical protein LCP9604111_9490 [Penicillium roqueforti]KAI1830841.1 hypothetical protein CBS147337_8458 [Penicillium roqueforti]KAI2674412.1 hypothetical protein CBS147355_7026 [Penicillium roqueforti]KAI2683930.1 hypothetical protein LCP963914a_5760 [Penicillium roqueforti]